MRKKIKVFVSGNFNIVHNGHLRLLKFARELGDELIVGLNSNTFSNLSVSIPEKDRLEALESIRWVDGVIILNESVQKTLLKLKPDIVVKGREFENQDNEEKIVFTYGGKLIFCSGDYLYTDYINRYNIDNLSIVSDINYLKRHSINLLNIKKTINKFNNNKILVIGDLIVDEYINCEAIGMSQEDPTIVVKPIENIRYLGGAAIVASHGKKMGGNVKLITVVGNDETGKFAKKELIKNNVTVKYFVDITRTTTLKQRVKVDGRSLLKISRLSQEDIPKTIQEKIMLQIRKDIKKLDALIFSDFNYGCLPQSLVEEIIEICNVNNVLTIADSQTSSQTGDITRYKNVTIICATEKEARVGLKNNSDGLIVLSEKLLNKTNSRYALIKLNKHGLIICEKNIDKNRLIKNDQLKALNPAPLDTSGAGDSMLIASSLAFISSKDIWLSGYIGSIAAALQISRNGNIPLTIDEIQNNINL